jgi:hypothetical protein
MTRKVSLRWLAYSNDPLAVKFRGGISGGSEECALCSMFFEDDYDDGEHISKCSFEEIHESEIEHFQQMADEMILDIKITSLGDIRNAIKEVVQFT